VTAEVVARRVALVLLWIFQYGVVVPIVGMCWLLWKLMVAGGWMFLLLFVPIVR
jgi:hypothetical protein